MTKFDPTPGEGAGGNGGRNESKKIFEVANYAAAGLVAILIVAWLF